MKITFVTDTYAPQPNGVATTLQRLVEGLRSLGHHVDIIRPAVLECSDEGLEVPSFALPKYPEVRVGLPIRLRLQARWFRNKPDAIYVATETPLGASAISAARALNIPVASGFHTNFQQYLAHYQLPLLERAAIRYLRHLHNRSTSTFVPSWDVINHLNTKGFKNLELLPKGVDTELFSPKKRDTFLRSEWGASKSSKVGIYVGRMAPEKNLPLILRTFTEIQSRFPDFIGVFVGHGPKLEQTRKAFPQFIYAGVKRGEELASHYASADLFVFPSITETFGNVTLEAMASGVPVLAFDYAAAKQHIVDGQNGFTVPFDDEEAYIHKAIEIMSQPDLSSLCEAARKSALKVRWTIVIKSFENDIVQMIQRSGRDKSTLDIPGNPAVKLGTT